MTNYQSDQDYLEGQQDAEQELAEDYEERRAPETALGEFASEPPSADYWRYEGYGTGGHVYACANGLYYGTDQYTVRFHVHDTDSGQVFGSMWAEGIDNVSVNLNDLRAVDALRGIVDTVGRS